MNMDTLDFDRLELLFRRTGALPALPTTAVELLRTIDGGTASAQELEQIIVRDPCLSGEFLRLAAVYGPVLDAPHFSTIRGAILVLGQRAVRSLAMSLMLRELVAHKSLPGCFDGQRFAVHSLASALLARYLYARRNRIESFESQWSADEVFAAALLSDLAFGLMARVAPDAYVRVVAYAKRARVDLNTSFSRIYNRPHGHLTAVVSEVWKLPEVFTRTFTYGHAPWEFETEFVPLSCITYADFLANRFDYAIAEWSFSQAVLPEIEIEVGVPEEELEELRPVIQRYIESYLGGGLTVSAA
jgi:HD-like signal output (HDOD) protein